MGTFLFLRVMTSRNPRQIDILSYFLTYINIDTYGYDLVIAHLDGERTLGSYILEPMPQQ